MTYIASHTMLSNILDQLETGIIVINEQGEVIHWNRWMSRRSGLSCEQVENQPLEAVFPEVHGSRLISAIKYALRDGLPSLLSPALHGTLLPLYANPVDRRHDRRTHQMTHILPLKQEDGVHHCIIQINDVSANISRERLLRQQAENLRRSTTEDVLTQIPNRKKFDEVLSLEFRKSQLRATPLSLAIADIDEFNNYNHHYGREQGDKVLAEIAAILRTSVRTPNEIVCRYGGEEFGFILPGMGPDEACAFAEKVRLLVLSRAIDFEHSRHNRAVTISIGITTMLPDQGTDTHTLVSSADVALYQAKHEGRNQAIYFDVQEGTFKACV